MRPQIKLFILIVFLSHLNFSLYAQVDTTNVFTFKLKSGAVLEGTILSETKESVLIKSIDGVEIKINKDLIQKREKSKKFVVGDKLVRPDPTQTKLFLTSTAQTLKQGKGYFSAYQIFFPTFAFGLTDNFMVSLGSSIMPWISFKQQLKFISAKLKLVDYKKLKFSVGGMYVDFWEGSFGTMYGVTTIGNYPFYFTAGFGRGFTEKKFYEGEVIVIGFHYQVSNRVSLMTENWFFTKDSHPVISFGIRFFGDNLSADFGFFRKTDWDMQESFIKFYPWIGFTYNF